MRRTISIEFEITHCVIDEGVLLQVWQYVDGAGDGGFSCLTTDYQHSVHYCLGVGQLALKVNNMIYDYIKENKL